MRAGSLGLILLVGCHVSTAVAPVALRPSWSTRDVTIQSGVVRGVRAGEAFAFRGIPYAAPPVGALRFSPPAAAPHWSAPREATAWGACCPQLAGGDVTGQEDCLTLNVWTPARNPSPPRPVLVFLHGGSHIEGCSAQELRGERTYEGDLLAARGVVVVTLNYRLGVLGFLTHEALGAASTNLGLRDQLAALAWVQKNIGAFGGDPERVLLFGESSGAVDTCAMTVSPRGKGLFSRALMQSGYCPHTDLDTAHKLGAETATAVGCTNDVAACLRGKTIEALIKSAGALSEKGGEFGPVLDGDVIGGDPLVTIAKGAHNHVPFIIGDNSAETLFWARYAPILGEASYRSRLEIFGEPLADRVLPRYPIASYPSATDAYVAATTDARFVCPARRIARALVAAQTEPVYRYLFTHALNTRSRAKAHGAMHGLELLFVFGHLHPSSYQPTPAEEALSSTMQDYWAQFAATGDPNGPGRTEWTAYQSNKDNYLALDDAPTVEEGLRSESCDFWDHVAAAN